MKTNLGFVLACGVSVLSSCIIAKIHTEISEALDGSTPMMTDFSWVFRLVLNLLGYATVLVPLYIMYIYLDKTKYFDAISASNPTRLSKVVSWCFVGAETRLEGGAAETPGGGAHELMFCFWGLLGTYLVWGLLQEKIMTQVLSKSCKIVAVLAMGALVSRRRPAAHEAAAALAVSLGVLMFMLGAQHAADAPHVMTVSGIVLLLVYLVCDSFTSSWQAELFHQYRPSPMQMMCYVSLFSCLLSAAALVRSDANWDTFTLLQNPVFLTDIVLLSLSSAAGQVLIYRTISKFGALVFTIIMTIRQALSILLSCLVFGHAVSPTGVLGIVIVFLALGLRQYCSVRLKRRKTIATDKL